MTETKSADQLAQEVKAAFDTRHDQVKAIAEEALGKAANIELKPGEAGDMRETAADIAATTRDLGWSPRVTVEEGIPLFVDWFRSYNRLQA